MLKRAKPPGGPSGEVNNESLLAHSAAAHVHQTVHRELLILLAQRQLALSGLCLRQLLQHRARRVAHAARAFLQVKPRALAQPVRTAPLAAFRRGEAMRLVCSDVAARGVVRGSGKGGNWDVWKVLA